MKSITTAVGCLICFFSLAQKIGINTTQPKAMLHVKDSCVLFEGPAVLGNYVGPAPASGAGARMMWFAPKGAFRAGAVSPVMQTFWNTENVGMLSFAVGNSSLAKADYSFAAGNKTRALGESSVAFGEDAQASGTSAFATGLSTHAQGITSTAIGSSTVASGASSMASGYGSGASGNSSFATGSFTFATGSASFACGSSSLASGISSLAAGLESQAIGDRSFATGYASVASGSESFAAGDHSLASGEKSTAFNSASAEHSYSLATGYATRAKAYGSTSMGIGIIAKTYGSLLAGTYNDTVLSANPGTPATTDVLFQIGNGSSADARSNALSLLRNGNMGLGTSAPTSLIHARANSFSTFFQLLLEENAADYARIGFKNTNTGNTWQIAALPAASNANAQMNFYWQGINGNILSLKGDGNATLAGTLTQNSDVRLKKNISRIEDPLELINSLNGYHYQWKDEHRDQALQTGLLAQEVEKLMPELVKEDDKGIKSVNYTGLIPYLLESIKQLQLEIQQLKAAR